MALESFNPGWLIAVGSISSAVVGAVALWVAIQSLRVARAAASPDVRVRVELDSDATTLINIVIENVGRSVAYDVRFELSRPIPERAFGFADGASEQEIQESLRKLAGSYEEMRTGPLFDGIPALGPGEKRVLVWGQHAGIRSWIKNEYVKVSATFKDERQRVVRTLGVLEMSSFYGCGLGKNDALSGIKAAVDKIAHCFEHAASDFKPIHVLAETPAERRARQQEFVEMIEANRANNA